VKLRVRLKDLILEMLSGEVELQPFPDKVCDLPAEPLSDDQEFQGRAMLSEGDLELVVGWDFSGDLVTALQEKLRKEEALDSVTIWGATDLSAWLQGVEIAPIQGLIGITVER